MNTPTKAIVFDAYGTLFDIKSIDEVLRDHFGDRHSQLSDTWRRKQLEYTWLRTLMGSYREFSRITMDALTYSCRVHELQLNENLREQLFQEYLGLAAYPEVMPVLHKLHGKFSLGILSNANHVMLRAAVAHNDLGDYFDQILSADQVKLFKPRPEVYQLACDQFKLSPEEIIFVSSNTWDVIGAKSFGFKTVWLNRSGAVMEALGFSADHMLEKMEQLTPKHVAFLQD